MTLYKIIVEKQEENIDFINKSDDFAQRNIDTTLDIYSKRRNNKDNDSRYTEYLFKQIKYSKLLEFYCFGWIINQTNDMKVIQGVDTKIYTAKEKKWTPDLIFEKSDHVYCFHVKLSMMERSGILYDYNDKLLGEVPKQNSYVFQEEDIYFNQKQSFYQSSKKESHYAMFGNLDYSNDICIHSIVERGLANKLFVMPFKREMKINGKTGKKVIMQKTCNTKSGFPCGVEEIPERIECLN